MKAEENSHAFRKRAYGMKKHDASYLHYDLRLEWNGVLLSWALREGPSTQPGMLRKAVEMDDHRLAYLQFEGLHRSGTIMLWDRGTWTPYPECEDVGASVRSGILRFTLHGEKLQGGWTLTRTNIAGTDARMYWTLCKHADAFAESWAGRCILLEQPNSITGKTMEELSRSGCGRRTGTNGKRTFLRRLLERKTLFCPNKRSEQLQCGRRWRINSCARNFDRRASAPLVMVLIRGTSPPEIIRWQNTFAYSASFFCRLLKIIC